MRSMQKAKPRTNARATSDMNPALPSINFVFKALWNPTSSTGATEALSTAMVSSINASLSRLSCPASVAVLSFVSFEADADGADADAAWAVAGAP